MKRNIKISKDKPLDIIAKHLVGINDRLDSIDNRLDGMDERFDRMDDRFDKFEVRFDRMEFNHERRIELLEDSMVKVKKVVKI